MPKEVRITPTAKADLEKISEYLYEEWGAKVTMQFLNRFDEVCGLIALSPGIFPLAVKRKAIRKAVITFHNTVYFKEYETFIDLLVIFDTRRNPTELRKVLKSK